MMSGVVMKGEFDVMSEVVVNGESCCDVCLVKKHWFIYFTLLMLNENDSKMSQSSCVVVCGGLEHQQ